MSAVDQSAPSGRERGGHQRPAVRERLEHLDARASTVPDRRHDQGGLLVERAHVRHRSGEREAWLAGDSLVQPVERAVPDDLEADVGTLLPDRRQHDAEEVPQRILVWLVVEGADEEQRARVARRHADRLGDADPVR
jgi:hypothetical protein